MTSLIYHWHQLGTVKYQLSRNGKLPNKNRGVITEAHRYRLTPTADLYQGASDITATCRKRFEFTSDRISSAGHVWREIARVGMHWRNK